MQLDLTITVAPDSPMMQWADAQENPYLAAGHVGTHLDTYEKTKIPADYARSRGVLFDVRGIEETDLEDVDLQRVQEGDFVLFRTGQMERFGYGGDGYFEQHPQLSYALIEALIKKKIHFIGVDCPGIRRGSEHEPADRLCEQSGIYVIENLCSLEHIPQSECSVHTVWDADEIRTGLPCKVIVQDSQHSI